jgi:ABC-type lipoprotein release transport system permease subunit
MLLLCCPPPLGPPPPGALKLANHHHLPSLAQHISTFLEQRLDWEQQQQQQVGQGIVYICSRAMRTIVALSVMLVAALAVLH